jgi:hypothetical protein
MKKWITTYSKLLVAPLGKKLRDLNANVVVDAVETNNGYDYITTPDASGWMASASLEPYVEGYPKDCVDIAAIQTPAKNDAEQYVVWKGLKQYNLCGQLCVAYLLGLPLSQVLEVWEAKQPSFFKRVFGSGVARGTGDGELLDMLTIFGEVATRYTAKSYTPHALKELAGGVIAGVKIDTGTGRLRGQGAGHWVVVTDVSEERTGYGLVWIYNPFPNRIEVYSWNEFVASARTPYGVTIARGD